MSIPAPRWLAAALLPLLGLMSEYSGLDRAVLDAFYDTRAAGWRFGADWWSNEFLHEGGRALIKLLAAVLLLVALAGLRWRRARSWRRASFYLLLCIGIGTGLVNATKAVSNVDCPRSLERYAGEHPYVHVFADRPDDLPRGRCFPAGHAAGGYSLLGLYFVALGLGWRRPGAWLLPGILVGALFSIAQWARGAHFPSHDLWAASICWVVAALLYRFAFSGRLRPAEAGPAQAEADTTGALRSRSVM